MIVRRLKKYVVADSQLTIPQSILEGIQRIKPLFFLILSVFIASLMLTNLSERERTVFKTLMNLALILQSAVLLSYILRAWIFRYLARKSKRDATSLGALSIFNFVTQVLVWTVALIITLDNMGYEVTTLMAGLGIGGIAVAMAMQSILGDLFASLSIVLDKPFVTGDFIAFDNYTFAGNVENIGIKTTRIRSLTGEQIVCSNNDLLNTRIRNFKRMRERRVVFSVGVVYQTPSEKLEKIPQLIREAVEWQSFTRFDRAHFQKYGDFALIYEVVYFVLNPDYNLYMDIQQGINLDIYQRFQKEQIEFAYPTQTLLVQNHQASGGAVLSDSSM